MNYTQQALGCAVSILGFSCFLRRLGVHLPDKSVIFRLWDRMVTAVGALLFRCGLRQGA